MKQIILLVFLLLSPETFADTDERKSFLDGTVFQINHPEVYFGLQLTYAIESRTIFFNNITSTAY